MSLPHEYDALNALLEKKVHALLKEAEVHDMALLGSIVTKTCMLTIGYSANTEADIPLDESIITVITDSIFTLSSESMPWSEWLMSRDEAKRFIHDSVSLVLQLSRGTANGSNIFALLSNSEHSKALFDVDGDGDIDEDDLEILFGKVHASVAGDSGLTKVVNGTQVAFVEALKLMRTWEEVDATKADPRKVLSTVVEKTAREIIGTENEALVDFIKILWRPTVNALPHKTRKYIEQIEGYVVRSVAVCCGLWKKRQTGAEPVDQEHVTVVV